MLIQFRQDHKDKTMLCHHKTSRYTEPDIKKGNNNNNNNNNNNK